MAHAKEQNDVQGEEGQKEAWYPKCSKCGGRLEFHEKDLGSMRNDSYRCTECGNIETLD